MNYIQITAGRGPVECARVVTLVARAIMKELPELQVVDSEPHNTFEGCYMSLTLGTEDEIPAAFRSSWEGTVLWRAQTNPYRPGHKRANWFVGVNFFSDLQLPEIREADIVYETSRSGGKGGQNVNKVETAVRAVHIPSGVAVRCTEERSQYQNRALARKRLILKLFNMRKEAESEARTERWSMHDNLQRGNPVRRFTGKL